MVFTISICAEGYNELVWLKYSIVILMTLLPLRLVGYEWIRNEACGLKQSMAHYSNHT